jgi:hypothetical protein
MQSHVQNSDRCYSEVLSAEFKPTQHSVLS